MQVRIHRGTAEIGGSCIEIAAHDGNRIVLDLGRPLWAEWGQKIPLPSVPGFAEPDPSLLALIISHPHLDHYGLAADLEVDVPVYIGKEAAALLLAASYFSPVSSALEPRGYLRHREPFTLGPFTVTPFLNDHSAFDAYSLLVEADGQRLFYTGDIRGHGRKRALFEELLARPPDAVDALLMEGTHVREHGAHDDSVFETESELEDRFVTLCADTAGAVVVFGSAQNLDRLVTVYRAARRSGRQLVVDLYGATVAAATRSTIPQPGFEDLRVYVPRRQRVLVKKSEQFWRTTEIKPHRVFPEELAQAPDKFIFHVPSSTARELIDAEVLDERGVVAWSMWEGYLRTPSGLALQALLAASQITLTDVHTSGHASVADLRRLVDALAPTKVVPIHSEAGDRFADLFPSVERQADGDWWEVGNS
jgi:ribonuclease J